MVINYPDTQTFCDYAIDMVPAHIARYKNVLDVMNVTGCRISEAININRWTFTSSSVWTLKPNKESNQRSFSTNILPSDWMNYFSSPEDEIHSITYRKIQYYMMELLRGYQLRINTKYLLAHVYRHNYAKALAQQGYTVSDIASNMGHKQQSSTLYYINSVITASTIPTLP